MPWVLLDPGVPMAKGKVDILTIMDSKSIGLLLMVFSEEIHKKPTKLLLDLYKKISLRLMNKNLPQIIGTDNRGFSTNFQTWASL